MVPDAQEGPETPSEGCLGSVALADTLAVLRGIDGLLDRVARIDVSPDRACIEFRSLSKGEPVTVETDSRRPESLSRAQEFKRAIPGALLPRTEK
jgi:hypothetical protein